MAKTVFEETKVLFHREDQHFVETAQRELADAMLANPTLAGPGIAWGLKLETTDNGARAILHMYAEDRNAMTLSSGAITIVLILIIVAWAASGLSWE